MHTGGKKDADYGEESFRRPVFTTKAKYYYILTRGGA
jgi:hypothetical protein